MKKEHLVDDGCSSLFSAVSWLPDYGFGVALFAPFAGDIVLAGFIALLLAAPLFELLLAIGVLTGAGVAGAGVLAGVAGLLFAGALLAGVSPQAMPRALNPRTVESAITFLILSDSYLSQRFYLYLLVAFD